MTQDHVETHWREQAGNRVGLAVNQPHPAADLCGLRRQRGAEVIEQLSGRVQPGDNVPALSQQESLRALPATDVEDPPRRQIRQAFRELPRHELSTHDLPQRAQTSPPLLFTC